MWLALPSQAPSSRHHLLIQFPLKNNGFNEGGNKIFRNFVKFCKIITPQTGRLPCFPLRINARRTISQTSNPSGFARCLPLKLPTPVLPCHQLGMGSWGGHHPPSWLPTSSFSEVWFGRRGGRRAWLSPRPGQGRGQVPGGSSLSWLCLRCPGCSHRREGKESI